MAQLSRSGVERILQKTGLPEFTTNTLTNPDALFHDSDTIRQRGWSIDDEERFLGMRCIAAPIHDVTGTAIAGISISGPTVRLPDELLPELSSKVVQAANEIMRLMRGTPK